jgi:hypothetical protein
MVLNRNMRHKVIFILASAIVFCVIDYNWVYPQLFTYLPQIYSWVIASTLAGCELSLLMVEWNYLDWKPLGIL